MVLGLGLRVISMDCSEGDFHAMATTRDAHLARSHVRKAVASEAKFHHLMAEIRIETANHKTFSSFYQF